MDFENKLLVQKHIFRQKEKLDVYSRGLSVSFLPWVFPTTVIINTDRLTRTSNGNGNAIIYTARKVLIKS